MEKMLQWYDEAKVGIFIHFGVYAVPGFRSEWFWCYWQCPDRIHPTVVNFMKKNYRPGFTYQDFATDFKLVKKTVCVMKLMTVGWLLLLGQFL